MTTLTPQFPALANDQFKERASMTILNYLIDATSVGMLDALVALGLALVFGLMGLINFAQGDLITTGAYSLAVTGSFAFGPRIVIMVIVAVVLALLMERVAFRPLRGAEPVTLLIASFAISYLLQNIYVIVFGGKIRSITLPDFFSTHFNLNGLSIAHTDVVILVAGAVLLILLTLFFNKTSVGLQMLASASDFKMARLLGVRANSIIALGFAISGFLAVVASLALGARLGAVGPLLGLNPMIIGFAGVIVGGAGSLIGSAIGGFSLGFISVMMQVVLPIAMRPFGEAFVFLLVILFVLVRPQGVIPGRVVVERV
jgi:branched-chain amino acid transport system permease protein